METAATVFTSIMIVVLLLLLVGWFLRRVIARSSNSSTYLAGMAVLRLGGSLALFLVTLVVIVLVFIRISGYPGYRYEAGTLEASSKTGPETAIEDTTPVAKQYAQSQALDGASRDSSCIEAQFAEATRGMSLQQATDYESGVISEAMARSVDPATVLAERGFSC